MPNSLGGAPIADDGRRFVAAYAAVAGDRTEPLLTDDDRDGPAIGGQGAGSGFSVTADGFLLTNRHVAAGWMSPYEFPRDANPGVLVADGRVVLGRDGRPVLVEPPEDWTPAQTDDRAQDLRGGVQGMNQLLYVTFGRQQSRVAAKLTRVSHKHDVAMIKVDLPEPVSKVELNDDYDHVRPGDAAVVLGYPGVSPPVYSLTRSRDVFSRRTSRSLVADPTVTPGYVGRVLRSSERAGEEFVSEFGDAYQLTANATGAGNSGGPVFDDRGRVIGIFFAGVSGDPKITFAVPIRYGAELMGSTDAASQ